MGPITVTCRCSAPCPASATYSDTRSQPRSATSLVSPAPTKLVGYSGLCPRVYQSGESDHRGSLTKNGPKYLRWALIEAATHAARHRAYAERYQRTSARLGRNRGKKIARVDIARRLAEAIWHMLQKNEPFAPAGAA